MWIEVNIHASKQGLSGAYKLNRLDGLHKKVETITLDSHELNIKHVLKGLFGIAPLPFFQLCVAKHLQLQKLRSKKNVELGANSTFFF